MVLTTPLLALLKEQAPTAEIDVLASPRNAPVVAGDPCVTRVYVARDGKFAWLRTILQLRSRRYDAIFSGQAAKHLLEARTASLVARSHTYKVSTWRPKRYQGLFTTVARIPPSATHTVQRLLHLGRHAFGIRAAGADGLGDRYTVRIARDPRADAMVDAFLSERGPRPFVLVNVSAHFAVRDWAPDRCAEVLRLFLARHPELDVVVTRAPGKEAQGAATVRLAARPRVVLAPALPVLGVAALVRRSVAVISVDTALVHIASACDRPVLALYAPVVPADVTLWRPLSTHSRVLASPLRRSVGDIPPQDITAAADGLLAAMAARA